MFRLPLDYKRPFRYNFLTIQVQTSRLCDSIDGQLVRTNGLFTRESDIELVNIFLKKEKLLYIKQMDSPSAKLSSEIGRVNRP
jgi:hypothetical protein